MQILDPISYVCVDQYDQTGSISNVCKNAGFRFKNWTTKDNKDDQTRKVVIGIVLAIILFVAVYFLIIKNKIMTIDQFVDRVNTIYRQMELE